MSTSKEVRDIGGSIASPEVGTCLVWVRLSQEASMVREEGVGKTGRGELAGVFAGVGGGRIIYVLVDFYFEEDGSYNGVLSRGQERSD